MTTIPAQPGEAVGHCVRGRLTGTFDLFHVGHVANLRAAHRYCEELTVAVLDDQIIRAHTGRAPHMHVEERLALVSSCRWVERAVVEHLSPAANGTAREVPDVLIVPADDWWTDATAESFVVRHGGRVVRLEPGSTSVSQPLRAALCYEVEAPECLETRR